MARNGRKSDTGQALLFACSMLSLCLLLLAAITASQHALKAKAATLAQLQNCTPPQWCVISSPNGNGANMLSSVTVITNNNIWAVGTYSITDYTGRTLTEHYNGVSWTIVPSEDNGSYRGSYFTGFGGVAAASANNIWAVGSYYTGTVIAPIQNTLLENYSTATNSWHTLVSSNEYTPTGFGEYGGNELASISALSSNEQWSVGAYAVGPVLYIDHALTERCDGSSCGWIHSTDQITQSHLLRGVVALASNDVYAVGNYSNNPVPLAPLIAHWDGQSWYTMTTNCGNWPSAYLGGVDAYASNDVWAVGMGNDGSYPHPLIEHYDGHTWTCTLLDRPLSAAGQLNSVFIDNERSLWAVGKYYNTSGGSNNLILHWHGSALTDTADATWDVITETNVSANNELMGVAAPSPAGKSPGGKIVITSTVAVGYHSDSDGSNQQTLIEGLSAPAAPISSTSYYVTNTDTQTHYNFGYCAAQKGGIVVLDYGQPITVTTVPTVVYGTALFDTSYTVTTTHAISVAVESFLDGYNYGYQGNPPPPSAKCKRSPGSRHSATIAIGTTNQENTTAGAVNSRHANAWADVVQDVQSYATRWHYYEIEVAAADDIEPGFGDFPHTLDWVKGYSNRTVSRLFNYGATEQYPCEYPSMPLPSGLSCAKDKTYTTWTAEQFYTVSWGINETFALPEIYHNSYSMYWYQVARWGIKNYNRSMAFDGVMTECGSSSCYAVATNDYTSPQGWQSFWLKLASDIKTTQSPNSMEWATDVACMTSPCGAITQGNQ